MLLMELQEKRDDLSAADMHTALNHYGILRCSLEQVEETVEKMIKAGQRYKYLEKILGPGVALVLGKEVPESMCAIIASFLYVTQTNKCQMDQSIAERSSHFQGSCGPSKECRSSRTGCEVFGVGENPPTVWTAAPACAIYGIENTQPVDAVVAVPIAPPVTVNCAGVW